MSDAGALFWLLMGGAICYFGERTVRWFRREMEFQRMLRHMQAFSNQAHKSLGDADDDRR